MISIDKQDIYLITLYVMLDLFMIKHLKNEEYNQTIKENMKKKRINHINPSSIFRKKNFQVGLSMLKKNGRHNLNVRKKSLSKMKKKLTTLYLLIIFYVQRLNYLQKSKQRCSPKLTKTELFLIKKINKHSMNTREKSLKEILMRTPRGKIKDEATKIKTFLSKHNIRNADATIKIFTKVGITLSDLMEMSEHDIKLFNVFFHLFYTFITTKKNSDLCKAKSVEITSKLDLLKTLRKIPESQVYKDIEAKNEPKTISQVIILNSNDHSKMDKIYEDIKKTMTTIENLQSEVVDLENSYNIAKKNITDTCRSIILSVEKNQQYLLQKIENYKNEKMNLLEQKLLLFQSIKQGLESRIDKINKCVHTYTDMYEKKSQLQQLLQDDNNYPLYFGDFNERKIDTNMNVQFTNEKEVEKLIQTTEQLLKQYIIILESGQITLTNVKIKESSKINANPIISLSYSTENIENILKDRSVYELEVTRFNDKELRQWEIFKKIPVNTLSDSTIEVGDEKEHLLEWNTRYTLRMRLSFGQGLGFTHFSNDITFNTSIEDEFMSTILTNKETKLILSFLPKGDKSKLILLYRGSRDGFDAMNFHQACDNKGKTLIILLDEFNHVFGGFTNAEWNSSRCIAYARDDGAFVYSLRNRHHMPQKWNVDPDQSDYAICNYCNYGPKPMHATSLWLKWRQYVIGRRKQFRSKRNRSVFGGMMLTIFVSNGPVFNFFRWSFIYLFIGLKKGFTKKNS
ncbi:hypothetical protein RFI_32286 [Reticulomyxa filosa]|uniref:TLDc domain-containing protein n=1 Tax=Reticulomyxa filosa TaxID=46433 RepID=X6LWK5_RETFI|nr:hypothetical protein RFI_32286 [Reticulomyxa filosa]|eukprot:ETO05110.1 hypothetical protein RFI_32286 [Reticulomyxa filosa]